MKKLILLIIISLSAIHAQPEIKQITDFGFDVKHPSFPVPFKEGFTLGNYLFFEVHNADSANIAMMNYNFANDEFENLVYLTRNGFINKNQDAFMISVNDCIAMWETNMNGNFDIAYSKYENGNWLPVQLATETSADETEISFVKNQLIFDCECALAVFNRNGSIFISDILADTFEEDTVFTADGDITYSQPKAGFQDITIGNQYLFAAAIRDSANVKRELVYRTKDDSDIWGEIKTVNLTGEQNNPGLDDFCNLIFDNIEDGKSSVYYLDLYNGVEEPEIIFSDDDNSYFNFKTVFFDILTKGYYLMYPYALQKRSGGENYVVASYAYELDTSVVVSVLEPQPSIGTLGVYNYYYVSYSVWVDSSAGHTNLFGVKRIDAIGDVDEDENNITGFTLSQNYPNPFSKGTDGNLSTEIQFSISSVEKQDYASQRVTLKIYDILGNEIATLVDEEKPPGVYQVTFTADSKLSAGVYFYRLQIGKFFQTKKMLVLK